ncbi:GNAT family N-acetyltransferase [Myxacorys almedinensis]|uniref:GNAT family N-acetyltransferase n=1 Tax=Myxacorys almedinensis A TaxID=2690445 RepID=A0A8J7Z3Z5_9CYAN|nr:GNAT family N-acetyltransferase [Myxacorys almedinensis]NDJ18880.1 GNAT family N-acetyltransferase [Myxacorys almedinensis A]
MSDVSVELAPFSHDPSEFGRANRDSIFLIRTCVFHHEQGIDPALEFDGKDHQAMHLLAYVEAQPVGTVRMREIAPQVAKLERLAVLSEFRNQGIGRKLTESALECLISKKFAQVRLHAQVAVREFYTKLGFIAEGDIFDEAGIPHIKMVKQISS